MPAQVQTRYCRACYYPLTGLPEPRCPECGQAFDLADPATFTMSPPKSLAWRWGRRLVQSLAILLLALAVIAGSFYRGYQREQKILATLHRHRVTKETSVIPAEWNTRLKEAGIPIFSRVGELDMWNSVSDEDLRQLAQLRSIRRLYLRGDGMTGDGIKHLAALPKLESLLVGGSGLLDGGLCELKDMPHLRLGLEFTRLPDAAFDQLTSMHHLFSLSLQLTTISQARLDELKRLPQLRHLQLSACKLTPEATASIGTWDHLEGLVIEGIDPCSAVREFVRMKNLRSLNIVGSNCRGSDDWLAIEEFKQARPDVSFWGP
jgi:hypothetical protein